MEQGQHPSGEGFQALAVFVDGVGVAELLVLAELTGAEQVGVADEGGHGGL